MKSFLITGSEGFIGKYLVRELKKNKCRIIKFDSSNKKDITKWKDVQSIPKVDVVFHLAARTFIPWCIKNPKETYEINTQGTLNILKYCRKHDAKLVYPSSYVYGMPEYLPIDENHPLKPNNIYTKSKLMAEKLCINYHKDYQLNCTILRTFNIYGPGQRNDFLIPSIVRQIKENNKIMLKDPAPKRDFIYVIDVIRALIKAANYKKFGIFNIGYGKSYSVEQVVKNLVKIHGKKIHVDYTNEKRKNEIMDCYADISKAKKELGWKPTVNLDTGLKNVYRLYPK